LKKLNRCGEIPDQDMEKYLELTNELGPKLNNFIGKTTSTAINQKSE